jgi:hypothetical protein
MHCSVFSLAYIGTHMKLVRLIVMHLNETHSKVGVGKNCQLHFLF